MHLEFEPEFLKRAALITLASLEAVAVVNSSSGQVRADECDPTDAQAACSEVVVASIDSTSTQTPRPSLHREAYSNLSGGDSNRVNVLQTTSTATQTSTATATATSVRAGAISTSVTATIHQGEEFHTPVSRQRSGTSTATQTSTATATPQSIGEEFRPGHAIRNVFSLTATTALGNGLVVLPLAHAVRRNSAFQPLQPH